MLPTSPAILVDFWRSCGPKPGFSTGSSRFLFWSLRAQQGARTLQNHYPAYFFDAPYESCKFRSNWSTLNFFCSKGPPFGYFFRILIKCKNVAFFVFRDTDPIFWLDTQDCPRNNSRPFPPGVTPFFAEKSALWCAGFCVLLLQPGSSTQKSEFYKIFSLL